MPGSTLNLGSPASARAWLCPLTMSPTIPPAGGATCGTATGGAVVGGVVLGASVAVIAVVVVVVSSVVVVSCVVVVSRVLGAEVDDSGVGPASPELDAAATPTIRTSASAPTPTVMRRRRT
jgi:hypothetical protein